ncbi:MAG: hypothetical protein KGO93_01700 [Cyanobacteria bacterium REEB446]|nr:hypothetical protein [Cyanobacteria bacterium REEB446]
MNINLAEAALRPATAECLRRNYLNTNPNTSSGAGESHPLQDKIPEVSLGNPDTFNLAQVVLPRTEPINNLSTSKTSNGAIYPATKPKQLPPLEGAAKKLFSREHRRPLLTQEEIRTLHKKIEVPLGNPDTSLSINDLAKAVLPRNEQRFPIDYLNTNPNTSAQG